MLIIDTKKSTSFKLYGKRIKYMTVFNSMRLGFELAYREFCAGNVSRAFDIYEQIIDAYPDSSTEVLLKMHALIKKMSSQDRYSLYQSRFFDFGIQQGDKVLDIGSGNVPFPMATHLADITINDDGYGRAGCAFKTLEGREVCECNIEKMPFADKEFDFVYCSHVLEHVENPEKACQEIMRVGKRGFIEVPMRGKDLFLNTARKSNHRWGIDLFNDRLIFNEYSPDAIKGTGCEVLMEMHCDPKSDRERAFSAMLTLRADLFNAMLLWNDAFEIEVRRLTDNAQSISPSKRTESIETSVSANTKQIDGCSMSEHPLKFMLVHAFYEPYLEDFYSSRPQLQHASYSEQIEALIADGFGAIHTYTPYLSACGYKTFFAVANCVQTQSRWLSESGCPRPPSNLLKEILRLQVERFKPDVLYLGNPIDFDKAFIDRLSFRPRLVMGWRAAPIPPGTNLSYLDLVLSHLAICRKQVLEMGARASEYFVPGVPSFIPDAVRDERKNFDVVFSGQWTAQHSHRNNFIKCVAEEAAKGAFTLGLFIAAPNPTALPPVVRSFNHGPRWGMAMYRALKSGRIVLNAEIDLARGDAGNMRLFETTGTGSFLLTEYQPNISNYFVPGEEIETFRDTDELLQKISHFLQNSDKREQIAQKGLERCLRDHSMTVRVAELNRIIHNHIKEKVQAVPVNTGDDMEDPYDRAYKWGWSNPELRHLVYLCYKTPDFADNARRFFQSDEFIEVIKVLSELGKPPCKKTMVLDIGCGNGVGSYAMARAGYSVIGLDSSSGKLAGIGAAKKIQNLDGVQFELVHAAGDQIECDDQSFDIIWMREVLHHIKDLNAFLSEAFRVLKPGGVMLCLRDTVIWNENQRRHFLSTHPFNHITQDEGSHYLHEYTDAFISNGFVAEKIFSPVDSVINTYPSPFVPNRVFNEQAARSRQTGYDMFSFFYRKPGKINVESIPVQEYVKPENVLYKETLATQFSNVSFGNNIQVIGIRNIHIGQGSSIGDNTWLNVCIRDNTVRMKIGKCVLIGRQAVISTGGFLEIADYCVLAPRVYVSDADHIFTDIRQPIMQQGVTTGRSVIVEENCWLGINTVISGNLTIGRGSVVAANAVVTKDVPPFSVAVGCPAVIVKMYNPVTKAWEKTHTPEALQNVISAREHTMIPSRDDYRKILDQFSVFKQIEPIVAGRNVNI